MKDARSPRGQGARGDARDSRRAMAAPDWPALREGARRPPRPVLTGPPGPVHPAPGLLRAAAAEEEASKPRGPWPGSPLSIGFPRQEYWSGLSLPSSGDVLNQGIKSLSPALAGGFFTTQPPGKPSTLQRKKKKTTKPSRMFPHSHPLISYFQTPYPGLLRKLSR